MSDDATYRCGCPVDQLDDRCSQHGYPVAAGCERCARADLRRFPILDGPSISWAVMAPYAGQIQRRHNQTLEQIAARGGLSVGEAVTLITHNVMSDTEARTWWNRRVGEYAAIQALSARIDDTDALAQVLLNEFSAESWSSCCTDAARQRWRISAGVIQAYLKGER